MRTSLKFGDDRSIGMVKEYELLIQTLDTYDSLTLRKRRANYKKKPVKPIKCILCRKGIDAGSLYYAAGARSAHDPCVDKAHDRRRVLGPEMGERPKRISLVKV